MLKVVDPQQFDFIPESSTVLALIPMFHCWSKATDGTGSSIRTVFLDYKKAFDLIDHTILIAKFYSFGVNPCIVNWIIDFLRNRWQRVKVNENCFSDWLKVPAGVPQGTRLGPWLFLAMINDLTLPEISSKCGNSLMIQLSRKSSKSPCKALYNPILTIFLCGLQLIFFNSIPLYAIKEMIISFTQSPSIYETVCMGNQLLERVTSIKSLGVTLRNDLKWNDHVNIITSKASKRLYLLKQLKRADVAKVELIKFYCSCIRSVLEYACQLFHSAL